MTNLHKLFRGMTLFFVLSIIGYIFSYVFRLVLARSLSLTEFGLFYAVFAFVSLLSVIKDIGLPTTVAKLSADFLVYGKIQKLKDMFVTAIVLQLSTGFIFVVGVLLASDYLVRNYFGSQAAKPVLLLLLIWLVFASLKNTFFALFQGVGNYVTFSLRDFLNNIGFLLFLVLFLLLGLAYLAPALSYSITVVILTVIFIPSVRKVFKKAPQRARLSKEMFRKVLGFGLPLLFATAGARVIMYLDTLTLTYFRTLGEVGVYNVTIPTAYLSLIVSTTIATSILPYCATLWAKKQKSTLQQVLQLIYKYAFLVLIPFFVGLFFYADFVIQLLFGEPYVVGASALQILLIGMLFYSVATLNNSVLSSIGKPENVAWIMSIAVFLNIILNVLLIPSFGINGAATATAVTYFGIFVLGLLFIHRSNLSIFPWSAWLRTCIAGVGFLGLILLLNHVFSLPQYLQIILVLLFSFAGYLGMARALKLFSYSDFRSMVSVLLRKKT